MKAKNSKKPVSKAKKSKKTKKYFTIPITLPADVLDDYKKAAKAVKISASKGMLFVVMLRSYAIERANKLKG